MDFPSASSVSPQCLLRCSFSVTPIEDRGLGLIQCLRSVSSVCLPSVSSDVHFQRPLSRIAALDSPSVSSVSPQCLLSVSSMSLQMFIFSDNYRVSRPWTFPISPQCLLSVSQCFLRVSPVSPQMFRSSFSMTPIEDLGLGLLKCRLSCLLSVSCVSPQMFIFRDPY